MATAEQLEDQLSEGREPRGEARRLPFLALVALDLVVVDAKAAIYTRCLAGYVLAKVWACLRYDDCRGVAPQDPRLRGPLRYDG